MRTIVSNGKMVKQIRLQGESITDQMELALSRMVVHLQRSEFEACHDILNGLEAESKVAEVDREALNCIASLGLDMREINLLETGGFVYVTDMDGIDLHKLQLPNMGSLERHRIRVVIEEARERLREEEGHKELEAIQLTQGSDQ